MDCSDLIRSDKTRSANIKQRFERIEACQERPSMTFRCKQLNIGRLRRYESVSKPNLLGMIGSTLVWFTYFWSSDTHGSGFDSLSR